LLFTCKEESYWTQNAILTFMFRAYS